MDRMRTLYEAALEGSVTTLIELLQQDRLILDRVISNGSTETPLHVAAMLGHVDFVKEILRRKPELAREIDSQRSLPLHLASAKGDVEVVKALLSVDPDSCLSLDAEGRNPLHLAAMKGRVNVLDELLRSRRLAAAAKAGSGETVLHLCVKHNQLEALKLLLEAIYDHEFLNAEDEYGMTILHLAVADKQIETIKFLLRNSRIEVNGLNGNGFTALDILTQSRRDVKDLEIGESLRANGAVKARDVVASPRPNGVGRMVGITPSFADNQPKPSSKSYNVPSKTKVEDWLTKKRDALMVVATLLATMTFQAGLTPPGNLAQNKTNGSSVNPAKHVRGSSITAFIHRHDYTFFVYCNTISFISSLSIILLLITGLPFKRRFFMWLLTVIVWMAITSMALTYSTLIVVATPKEKETTVTRVVAYSITFWCALMALLLLGHTIRLTANLFRKLGHLTSKRRRPSPLLYP